MCKNQNKIKNLSKIVFNRARLVFTAFFLLGVICDPQVFAAELTPQKSSLQEPLLSSGSATRNPIHSYQTMDPIDSRITAITSGPPSSGRSPLVDFHGLFGSPAVNSAGNPSVEQGARVLFAPYQLDVEGGEGQLAEIALVTAVNEEDTALAEKGVDQIKHYLFYMGGGEMKDAVIEEYPDISADRLPALLAKNAMQAADETIPAFLGSLLVKEEGLRKNNASLKAASVYWRNLYLELGGKFSVLQKEYGELHSRHTQLNSDHTALEGDYRDLESGMRDLKSEWAISLQLEKEADIEELRTKTFALKNEATTARARTKYLTVALGAVTAVSMVGYVAILCSKYA
ncbi:MAG: hypothetical protein EBT45_01025 [Alphaproteobacteria bacterium]|nr:hypothetical protein [Alphaproteobacteria bacterium]